MIFFLYACSDCGAGGEKVLWQAVKAIQNYSGKKDEKIHVLMYSGSKLMPDQILKHKVELRFGLKISQ